jgi:aminopeptidase-like protein
MTQAAVPSSQRGQDIGHSMYEQIRELYPLCRSITGNGVRQSLHILKRSIPLEIREVPTGTQVFDWTVPKEWNITDAYVKNAQGERIVDFKRLNLHVMSYSVPVNRKMSLAELRPHLFSLPELPDWVPHKTSYYKENWGFSLSHRQLQSMEEGEYEVCIDSTLTDGALTYGEYVLPGASQDEVLISTHTCHPSLCNDNLSGIAVSTALAQALTDRPRRYTYRFLFIPTQIGSITWLALHEHVVPKIKHGLVLVGLGDSGSMTYKRSRQGQTEIDRASIQVLKDSEHPYKVVDFFPFGYDERQYCSPGFDLPVGSLMRTPHGQFPEYHTSGDNLEFVKPAALADSFHTCLSIVEVLERNKIYVNQNPKCEPRLGPRGLYRTTGGHTGSGQIKEMPILWTLNLSDGTHSLLDIAERAGLSFSDIASAAEALEGCGLLREKTRSL